MTKKKEKGITLIALVVTIVVLLILAGISISMLTGENGVITQANKSSVKNDNGTVAEALKLKISQYLMDNQIDEQSTLQRLKDDNIINEAQEINIKELLGEKLKTGNGANNKDVYVIEKNETGEYELFYYDKKQNSTNIGYLFKENVKQAADSKYFDITEDGVISIKNKDEYSYYVQGVGNIAVSYWHLEELVIPSEVDGIKVTGIENYFMAGNQYIKEVYLPDSIEWIGKEAFSECSSLTNITIPDSVTSIGYETFYRCSSLTNITIPDSVTWIEDRTFEHCSSLTSITIGDSVTSIGDYAFYCCSSLTSIVVSEGNNVYDSRNNCNAIIETSTNTLILGCNTTVIPDGVTSIGYEAFCVCSSLTSITIPDSVMSIEERAFSGCSSLTSITIPDSVTSIGDYAFSGCSSLTSITIPDSVMSIEKRAFYYCSSLTSITIGDGVTSIGYETFYGCSSLTSIVVSEGNNVYDSRNNCNAIIKTSTNGLILGCNTTVIPDGVISIGYEAFYKCSSLTSITIPDSVTWIGDEAFYGCSSLTSITIPDSVTWISIDAFNGCSSLTTVNYKGTEEQWNKISISSGNSSLTNATINYNYTGE